MKQTKLSIVKAHMAQNDWAAALSIAAKFPRLGDERNAVLSAHGAYTNPRFYAQIGKDLEQLKAAGRNALIVRFGGF